MPQGFFITFEGLDGCGKSTQLRKLAEYLSSQGMDIVVTRQPGGTAFGDRLRSIVLDSRTGSLAPFAELAVMFADRAQCIAEVIGPALTAGKVVLCDRFTDSTEAYQGGGRELGREVVLEMHRLVCGNLKPDLTILLQPDFATSLSRARRRNDRQASAGKDEGRFEREQEAFFTRVRDTYQAIAAREPVRVVTLDGDASIDVMHQRIVELVEGRLAEVRSAL
jgi:dTMP kinase